jgi:queuosine precursor transporter
MIINTLIYILAVLVANYTTTPEWFIALPIYGQVPLGTFIFGVTFTQRDRLHQYGRRYVYTAIALAGVATVIMSAELGVPQRIIIASFTAIILAEAADTEVYQQLLHQSWLTRVLGSNAVSIPLDTLLFNTIAFLGDLPLSTLVALMFGDIVIKSAIGALTALYRGQRAEPMQG